MKKIFSFIVFFAVILFVTGCDQAFQHIFSVSNKSDVDIKFSLLGQKGYEEKTFSLRANESLDFTVIAGGTFVMLLDNPRAYVKENEYDYAIIQNLQSFPCHIKNDYNSKVQLKENNNNLGENGNGETFILEPGQIIDNLLLYTDKPAFTITSDNYLLNYTVALQDGTFYVRIF